MEIKQLNTKSVLRNQIINSAISAICFFVLLATALSCLFLVGLGIFISIILFIPLFVSIPALGLLLGLSLIVTAFSAFALATTISTALGLGNKPVKNKLKEIQIEISSKKLNISIIKNTLSRKLAFLGSMHNLSISDSDEEEEDLPITIKNLLIDISSGVDELQNYLVINSKIVNQLEQAAKSDLKTAKNYNDTVKSIIDAVKFLGEIKKYSNKYLSQFFQPNDERLILVNNIDWIIQDRLGSLQPKNDSSPLLIGNTSNDY